jgi:hypothetical protein
MKNKIHLIALLLICSLISSCESDDLNYQNDFENSQKAWLDFKESTDNSYQYTVTSGTWAGSSWETTISVSNGEITQRHFKYTITEGLSDDISEEDLEWTENENGIGSHDFGIAAEPMSLDEVYNKAKEDWLVKRENTKTYFDTENNGLISRAGYVDNNCVDDCFVGIKIKSIQAL